METYSQQKMFLYRLLGKIHQLFHIVIHLIFKVANFGNKEELPPIDNYLLLGSASSLACKIRKQKLKSYDLVQAYIARILEVNPIINAAVAIRQTEALEEAHKVDKFIISGVKTEEQIARETPFLGVPFTSKEIICVAGMPLTAGLVARRGLRSDKDSDVVNLMKKAGAIVIAVTNTSELAMWTETHNKVYGRTSNPYDVSRGVGGSTGGEGALLAAAGSVIGLGNDIGGSIRIPACFNGIFGHKPTAGVVSNTGCFSTANKDLECYLVAGPMCRYATDLLPMMNVLAGHNAERLKLHTPVNLHKLKIFYMDDAGDFGFFTKVHPDIKMAMSKVLRHFEHAYKIKPQKLQLKIMKDAIDVYLTKIHAKGGFKLSQEMSSGKKPTNLFLELFLWLFGQSKHTLHLILVGISDIIGQKFSSCTNNFPADDLCRETVELFQQMLWEDAVFLYPAWPEPAPHHHEMLFKPFNFGYTAIFNILGFPVTVCPLGLGRDGLPIAIQVVSNPNNDRLCMGVAVELEKAFGGWVPPCPAID